MKHYSKSYCKNEKIFLFLLSRLNPSTEAINYVNLLIKNHPDFIELCRIKELAFSNGVGSLIYRNLRLMEYVPETVMESFRNAYLLTVKTNAINMKEMIRILKILKQNKINAIPLKGAVASEIIFGDIGIYPSSDIDILIHPEDIQKAENLLFEAGYSKAKGLSDTDLLSNHYHLIYQKEVHTIELHWNLVKRYFYIPPEFWWQDSWQIMHEGIKIPMLSHERYLMYAIFRLFDHGFRPLKFFVLISEIVNKYKDNMDWQKLQFFAKQYKMERLVLFTLRTINYMFDTAIPKNIIRRKILGYELIKRHVISNLFSEVKRPHLRMLFYTCLLDSPRDFLNKIVKRVFPTSSEIRLRYGVSEKSKKIYVYYLLNPLLIFLKKKL